ncbi:MAG: cupredoxin domain-containing protein [Pseudomonadales bacterium]|nr:cupredoxin domain-containing protein [Pseudomonadales bacterium]
MMLNRSKFFVVTLGLFFPMLLHAKTPIIKITIKNHLFYPSEVIVPAGKKVKLLVSNEDNTPEEFESYELNREKIITGNRKAVIFIGPLKPGSYPFFGEFYPRTAQGMVIAQ